MNNIFKNIPDKLPDELIETIKRTDNVKIERIISKGHSTEPGSWYDQKENEWVLLLKGKAKLKFENEEIVGMSEGDYINIPANKKHRVEWTDPENETIWLCVFY